MVDKYDIIAADHLDSQNNFCMNYLKSFIAGVFD